MSQKIWLVTGVSGGLGRALAATVAKAGDIVYGTLRKQEQVEDFNRLAPGYCLGLLMDVNKPEQVKAGVEKIIHEQGRLDVLVNNAGYGLFGAVEEVSMEEARQQMETNFFGALSLTKEVLPYMRERKGGSIVQVSSVAGFRSAPGLSIYNASKFALEGFTEALWYELAPLGVKVMIVMPGPFRTNWAGSSSIRSQKVMDVYRETSGARIRTIHQYSGTQPGDPEKAAELIMKVVNSENPPLRLPLGALAYEAMESKMDWVNREMEQWREESKETSF